MTGRLLYARSDRPLGDLPRNWFLAHGLTTVVFLFPSFAPLLSSLTSSRTRLRFSYVLRANDQFKFSKLVQPKTALPIPTFRKVSTLFSILVSKTRVRDTCVQWRNQGKFLGIKLPPWPFFIYVLTY